LPLIAGDIDPRMDKLKQWIVNLDHQSKADKANRVDNSSADRLLRDFFKAVATLTQGLPIRFGGVDDRTFEVTVITNDGQIPIESVSQGTTSLLSWVGILLQRLYEIYDDPENPRNNPSKQFALVLMDELDAHMHPAWQQNIIPRLRELFPGVQFIASTHSPLIVGGMKPEEVIRFTRDGNGKVMRLKVDQDMTMGRADQILTGTLFGLDTTLDQETQSRMQEYEDLLGNSNRSAREEERYRELEAELEHRIPPSGETPLERRAQEMVQDVLTASYDPENIDELKKRLVEKGQQLSSALHGGKEHEQ
jgi:predicted ATP-binding protein involved in virulence